MNRRDIIKLGAKTMLAVPALAVLLPGAGYLTTQPQKLERGGASVSIGSVEGLRGTPGRREFSVAKTDAWREITQSFFVWAYSGDEGSAIVFSPVCPHAGCLVDWRNDESQFICPCHFSTFTIDGTLVSGPSPTDLNRLATEIIDGEIYIQVEEML